MLIQKTKQEWLQQFREYAGIELELLEKQDCDYKMKANAINSYIKNCRDALANSIQQSQKDEPISMLLESIMLMTYASYVVMLESRNSIWKYDYMAFSRRIGELWEPFCKLPFEYPVKALDIITPPVFDNVKQSIQEKAHTFIDNLSITSDEKKILIELLNSPWQFVDSGNIKLTLDLHFKQDNINYNCDFKSGFSSNEKGNTNRLLLVASVYRALGNQEKTLLFVRQKEDENNHYLTKLKNSGLWQLFCADECYKAIYDYTGFSLRKWLDANIDWCNDISPAFKSHLIDNNLLKYLSW